MNVQACNADELDQAKVLPTEQKLYATFFLFCKKSYMLVAATLVKPNILNLLWGTAVNGELTIQYRLLSRPNVGNLAMDHSKIPIINQSSPFPGRSVWTTCLV